MLPLLESICVLLISPLHCSLPRLIGQLCFSGSLLNFFSVIFISLYMFFSLSFSIDSSLLVQQIPYFVSLPLPNSPSLLLTRPPKWAVHWQLYSCFSFSRVQWLYHSNSANLQTFTCFQPPPLLPTFHTVDHVSFGLHNIALHFLNFWIAFWGLASFLLLIL